jgi:hypothetical protein
LAALILLAVGLLPGIPLLGHPADPLGAGSAAAPAPPHAMSSGVGEQPTPAWRAPSSEGRPVRGESPPLTRPHAADLAAALSAWLPERGSLASLTPPKTRSGALTLLARIEAGWGAAWLGALGAAPSLRSPLPSAVGLRWARSLRGPPTGVPSI